MKRALALALAAMMIFAAASLPEPAVAQSGRIQIIPGPDSVGPSTRLTVLISDGDLNGNAGRINEYEADDVELVTFRTDRSELGEASPDLEETGENTGVFAFTIQLETDEESCDNDRFESQSYDAIGGSDPGIGACPGDVLYIGYEDSHTPSGGEEVISLSVEIKSWDPEFSTDMDSYSLEDKVTVSITDPDANRDPDRVDSIRDIRVYSDSDTVGNEFSALETGEDTGVFRLIFAISAHGQGNAIQSQGDVTVEYTDEFPADISFEEKTFIFQISSSSDFLMNPPLESSSPEIIADGALEVGKQIMISISTTSNVGYPQPFVQIVEVRESSGLSVFLAWQILIANPYDKTEVGISWTPDRPDYYEVRTFTLTNLSNPQVLSLVRTAEFTVE